MLDGNEITNPKTRQEINREKRREYYRVNKEKINQHRKIKRDANPEKYRAQSRKSYHANKEKYFEHRRNLLKSNVGFRIRTNLCRRINHSLTKGFKSAKTLELLGCSVEELKAHLESKFKDGMTWDNYGIKGWHIDHIIPCSAFNLTDPEQQKKCFHYTNLQPLWWQENLTKRNKII